MKSVTNVKFAGLGGQGILTCTDILGRIVFDLGNDVKKAEVHGMSQRGGSITSDLRFGKKVFSPMIPEGEADYLILMNDDQLAATAHHLKAGGKLVKPSDFDATQLSNKRALNVALLGALSKQMDYSIDQWMSAIHAQFPDRLWAANEQAFNLGRGE